jgi:hypothetical protein
MELFAPLHKTIAGIAVTVVVGFTVIVKFSVCPTQVEPPVESVGVTETIEDSAEFELELVVVNPGIVPDPFEANPMLVFPLIHAKVVFKALLPNEIGFVNVLLQ